MRTNQTIARPKAYTHEGGRATKGSPEKELARTVATCLLWENTFYEGGDSIADRIATLCRQVDPEIIGKLAVSARTDLHLRHVPLFLALQLIERRDPIAGRVISEVIQRPDEMSELLSLYWKDGKRPLAKQLKKGLAAAFRKFSPYQLSKWDRESKITLRDVMFLTHPAPFKSGVAKSSYWQEAKKVRYQDGRPTTQWRHDSEQAETWRKLANKELESADTWEVALSRGENKKETWERLLTEKKLGYMALLMNLRNMAQANVKPSLVGTALIDGAPTSRALPFRFVSAAKHAPQWRDFLSEAMELSAGAKTNGDILPGKTVILIDVSGSMDDALSAKSTLTRLEAAGALAVLARGMSDRCEVYTFSYQCVEVEAVRGLGLIEAVARSQQHGGTYLGGAIRALANDRILDFASRLIVITDEQVQAGHELPMWTWLGVGYVVNVAPYQYGLAMKGGWKKINGWSDRVLEYIMRDERGEFDD